MDATEATANIIIALIDNNRLASPEEVSSAYKAIFEIVSNPYEA